MAILTTGKTENRLQTTEIENSVGYILLMVSANCWWVPPVGDIGISIFSILLVMRQNELFTGTAVMATNER